MCGIIGIVGTRSVQERLIDSLKRLEYRGYDSAGVAGVVDGRVQRRRAAGKIKALEEVLAAELLKAKGRTFESETDTEVIAALIDYELSSGKKPVEALKAALDQLTGAYAIG